MRPVAKEAPQQLPFDGKTLVQQRFSHGTAQEIIDRTMNYAINGAPTVNLKDFIDGHAGTKTIVFVIGFAFGLVGKELTGKAPENDYNSDLMCAARSMDKNLRDYPYLEIFLQSDIYNWGCNLPITIEPLLPSGTEGKFDTFMVGEQAMDRAIKSAETTISTDPYFRGFEGPSQDEPVNMILAVLGQKHHAGRCALNMETQALANNHQILGIGVSTVNVVICDNAPNGFPKLSQQPKTQNHAAWVAGEEVAIPKEVARLRALLEGPEATR